VRRWFPALAALAFAVVALPAAAVPAPSEDEQFAFADPRIHESSGLVDLGRLMVTVNDSGDSARVFVVDARTGRTVGITDYHVDAVDDEALAPAGAGHVWVGDLGDNSANRSSVTVSRVPVAARQIDVRGPERYRLRYADGPHDAESLVVAGDGSLYVITKSLAGGVVFRTDGRPRADRITVLRPVARVPDYATDAALLPDGRHVLVRSLAQASVYTFPGFRVVGRFELPSQQQGEGVSVGPDGRIRLSSEGAHAPVLQVALPAEIAAALRPAAPSPEPSQVPPVEAPKTLDRGYDDSTVLGWAAAGLVGLVAVGVGIGLRRR
jgi:hypothetical protein